MPAPVYSGDDSFSSNPLTSALSSSLSGVKRTHPGRAWAPGPTSKEAEEGARRRGEGPQPPQGLRHSSAQPLESGSSVATSSCCSLAPGEVNADFTNSGKKQKQNNIAWR